MKKISPLTYTETVLVSLLLSLGTLAACEKRTELTPLESVQIVSTPTHAVRVNFCTPPVEPQKLYVKTLVILDHSGSNAENYKMAADGSGAPDVSSGSVIISPEYATDPKGLTRYGTSATPGTLLNYLSTLPANDPADPTRFFALINFSSGASTYPSGSRGFTSDISDFYNHVSQDAGEAQGGAPNDTGSTSYLSALTAAYNIINNDIQAAKACAAKAPTSTPTTACPKPGVNIASSYAIVFMSDGSPIVKIEGVGVDSSGNTVVTGNIVLTKESTTDILAKVGTITNLQSDDKFVAGVNFFTIYYYQPGNIDTSSQTILAQMARAGNGMAYNALAGSNINYQQFQPPSKQLRYTLSDVFVTNANAVWWTDGKLHPDTDADGLPDSVESAWGSDPQRASSDGNGIKDLVKYQLKNGVCNSQAANGLCQDPVPDYRTGLCSGIRTVQMGGQRQFVSSDPNGLNDCEKILLNNQAGIGTPDSNKDSIPDWLEFLNNVPFQSGTTPAVTIVNQDGYTTYEKIKFSLPVNTPLNTLSDVLPSSYQLNQVLSSTSQDCYQLTVRDFPLLAAGNRVRVDVIMKNNLIKDSILYKVGFKSFPANTELLEFNDWNDPAEVTNKTWSVWP